MASISIVFVLYNQYEELDLLLRSNAGSLEHLTVVIVDNTPAERIDHERLEGWSSGYGTVTLLPSEGNVGYSGAAQMALDVVPGLAESEFFIVANTDLQLDLEVFCRELGSLAPSQLAGVGALAPQLLQADGGTTRQHHYVTEPRTQSLKRLSRIYSFYPLAVVHRLLGDLKRRLRDRRVDHVPSRLFAPHGALLVVTQEYLARTAQFRFPVFLFCEEHFLGYECRDAGLRCIYAPSLRYAHTGHGSMGRLPSRNIVRYLHEAHDMAARRALRQSTS